jgi:hypothetical protein
VDFQVINQHIVAESRRQEQHPRTRYYPHCYSTTTPVSAIRAGSWKLLEYFEHDGVELHSLNEDLGETTNLAAQFPEKAE